MDAVFAVQASMVVGLLIRVYRPFETLFQSISGRLPERGKKEERNDR